MEPTRVDDFQGCSRTYATLCIYHVEITPEEITSCLGLDPDRVVRKGQRLRLGGGAPRHAWIRGTRDKIDSKDLRSHIDFLTSELHDKLKELFDLDSKGCEMRIMCFWASASGNGGPYLDHQVIVKLAELPFDLDFDVWFDGGSDGSRTTTME